MDIDITGKFNNWTLFTYIFFNSFPGRLKYAELGNSLRLTFWVPVPKVIEVIP